MLMYVYLPDLFHLIGIRKTPKVYYHGLKTTESFISSYVYIGVVSNVINQNQKPQAAGIAADVSEVKRMYTERSLSCLFCNDGNTTEAQCRVCPINARDFQATPGQAIREANTGTRETGFKPGTWLKGKTFAAESLGGE
jgi:hypothetical protein